MVQSLNGLTPIPQATRDQAATTAASGEFRGILEQATAPAGNLSKTDPHKLADAARQFEGLMISQMLKSAHSDDSDGWLGAGDDDQSSSTAIQMAVEYLGQAMANGGGVGIAKMVVKGLGQSATTPNSDPALEFPSAPHKD